MKQRKLEPSEPKTRCTTPLGKPELADTAWADQWMDRLGGWMGKCTSHDRDVLRTTDTGGGGDIVVRVHGTHVQLQAGG